MQAHKPNGELWKTGLQSAEAVIVRPSDADAAASARVAVLRPVVVVWPTATYPPTGHVLLARISAHASTHEVHTHINVRTCQQHKA